MQRKSLKEILFSPAIIGSIIVIFIFAAGLKYVEKKYGYIPDNAMNAITVIVDENTEE
jgi:hypothetical protein